MINVENKKHISQKALQLYLKEIEQYSDLKLTPEEERELFKKIGKGDEEAKKQLARAYLMLVVKIVQYYAPRIKKLTILELIQEGNLGLYRAIELFNSQSTYRFLTFVTLMIREAVLESFKKAEEIIRIRQVIEETIPKLCEEAKKGRFNKKIREVPADILEEPKRKKFSQKEKIIWVSKIKRSIQENISEIVRLLSEITTLSKSEVKREIERFLKEK